MLNKPYFELSKSKVLKQLKELEPYCDQVSYSFKTNYEVGAILEKESTCFFSVHSTESLFLLKDFTRIWFFAQAWDEKELQELFSREITHFVVDNETDLQTLLDYLEKEKEKKIDLLLRIRLKEHTVQTGKHFVFGMYSHQVNRLLPKLAKNNQIKQLGIHFHRKTQNVSEWSLQEELSEIIYPDNWKNINIVNIGGGLPVEYKNYRAEAMPYIFKKIADLKTFLTEKNIKMIIEPGRYIAAPSVKLVTQIKSIYDHNIIVNGSVYNSAMDTFVAHIRLLIEGETDEGEAYTVKGSTPCSTDIFRYQVILKNPKEGDNLIFLNAGAYNFRSDFCCLPKLETKVIP